MKIDLPMAAVAMVVAITINLALYYLVGPTVALIEAIPGGLLIGILSQYRLFLNARRQV